MEIGFYTGTTLWVILEFVYGVHILLAYQPYWHSSYRDLDPSQGEPTQANREDLRSGPVLSYWIRCGRRALARVAYPD